MIQDVISTDPSNLYMMEWILETAL
jgi:hypothetical protein